MVAQKFDILQFTLFDYVCVSKARAGLIFNVVNLILFKNCIIV